MALIDSAFDRSEDCQTIIASSLFNLGKKKPELVLSSCYSYLKKHSKVWFLFSLHYCDQKHIIQVSLYLPVLHNIKIMFIYLLNFNSSCFEALKRLIDCLVLTRWILRPTCWQPNDICYRMVTYLIGCKIRSRHTCKSVFQVALLLSSINIQNK